MQTSSHWETALTLSLDSYCMNIHSGVEVHDGLLHECYKEATDRNLTTFCFTKVLPSPTSLFWDFAVFVKVFVVMNETQDTFVY